VERVRELVSFTSHREKGLPTNAFSIFRKNSGGSGVAGGSSRVFARPIPLAVARAKNVLVDGISITNSPFWHSIIFESSYVTFQNIFIKSLSSNASAPAANTDGCKLLVSLSLKDTDLGDFSTGDTYRSDHLVIRDSVIINGDDCVSFKPNTTNMLVENLVCDGSCVYTSVRKL
jgi:galacturan 1,4-alpha-galacturonidase